MHWPVKLRESGKPLFFKLSFWDCGEAVLKKFDHILPVSSCPPHWPQAWVWVKGRLCTLATGLADPVRFVCVCVPSNPPPIGLLGESGRRPLPLLLHGPRVLQ